MDTATTLLGLPATVTAGPGPGRQLVGSPDIHSEVVSGARVGPYRIRRAIGQGGMGAVYLASRADREYLRDVAIKVLRPGLDSAAVKRRFRSERQILANLDHPNIAKLFDGGTTADGRPYFAMEYIDGIPIDRYCERCRLSIDVRLKLFCKVAEAVHYAHQNLIVHRDIKPSNILVTPAGEPKLLDFGIAKFLDPTSLPYALEATLTESRPMTPSYASPEQLLGGRITTASDVYALGVLLFRLLTGRLPFQRDRFKLWQIERMLAAEQPLKPSAAVIALSSQKPLSPQKLHRRLAGDLDNIVLKALRIEPERRYGSAEQLAADLRCHLHGLPVAARPATYGYRTGKFLRRHKLAVVAGALFVILLIGFGVTMAWQAVEIADQRDRAEVERDRAREAVEKTDRALAFLVDLFEVADPGEARGASITAKEILDSGADEIRELDDQPDVQASLADAIGKVYRNLGLYNQAEPLLRGALETRRSFGAEPAEVVTSYSELATLYFLQGDLDRAESFFRKAVNTSEEALGPEHPELGINLNNLANVAFLRGNLESSEALLRRALTINEKALGAEHREVATILNNLANIHQERGESGRAAALLERSVRIAERELGGNHPELAMQLNNLAATHFKNGELERAAAFNHRALAIWTKTLAVDHPQVAFGLDRQADLHSAKGEFDLAEQTYRRSLKIREQAAGRDHPRIAQTLNGLGASYLARGDTVRAQAAFERAVEICETTLGNDHFYTAFSRYRLGDLYVVRERWELADSLLLQVLTAQREGLGDEHPAVARSSSRLADLAARRGQVQRALDLYEQSLEILERYLTRVPENAVEQNQYAAVLIGLGVLLRQQGEVAEARKLWHRAATTIAPIAANTEALEPRVTQAMALIHLERRLQVEPLIEALWQEGWRHPEFVALGREHGLLPAAFSSS